MLAPQPVVLFQESMDLPGGNRSQCEGWEEGQWCLYSTAPSCLLSLSPYLSSHDQHPSYISTGLDQDSPQPSPLWWWAGTLWNQEPKQIYPLLNGEVFCHRDTEGTITISVLNKFLSPLSAPPSHWPGCHPLNPLPQHRHHSPLKMGTASPIWVLPLIGHHLLNPSVD